MPTTTLSKPIRFKEVQWSEVPETFGFYVIYDQDEVI
jgi:hypothetical protein